MTTSFSFKKITFYFVTVVALFSSPVKLFSQNSLTGDGFGGRLWYTAHNFQVGAYSAYTVCGIDSQLYAWGGNHFAELGDGSTMSRDTPVKVIGANHVKFYTTGYMSGAITSKDSLLVWGWLVNSALWPDMPRMVNTTNVKFVDAGIDHLVFVKRDSTVWGLGRNTDGQLGTGSPIGFYNYFSSIDPVQMQGINDAVRAVTVGLSQSNAATLILLKNGQVKITGGYKWFSNDSSNLPVLIPGLDNIVDIKGNYAAAFALKSNGDVFALGKEGNYVYCLGLGLPFVTNLVRAPTKITFPAGAAPIVALSANNDGISAMALDENGNVYSWGDNYFGQLGDGTEYIRSRPQLVATNAIDIFAGETFSYILKADNTLWATGSTSVYGGSIWMNLPNVQRNVFTQINPTIFPMNICAPKIFGTVPVKLLAFNCLAQKNTVSINWHSAEEINFGKYIIQTSSDGIHFNDVAIESAKGNNTFYAYTIEQLNPVTFYRLKLLDNDGNISYSDIRKVTIVPLKRYDIYPNPVTDRIFIADVDPGNFYTEIYSITGILEKKYPAYGLNKGIDVSFLNKGMHVLTIIFKTGDRRIIKFIKN